MATRSLGQLTIDLVAKIGGFTAGMTQAERAADRSSKAIVAKQKAAAQAVQKAWATAFSYLGGALAVRGVVEAADTYKLLESRIRVVTNTAQEFATAQAEVSRIAFENRTTLSDTANLYTQLSRSVKGLGVSQSEVLGVTESINHALLVSGGSADSAKAAITQLSQAFASGVLRGEEFNSVAEQAPRILQAIAKGMNVGLGELRAMAEDGALTATRVIRALQSQAAVLEAEAKGIPTTIGQAVTQAGNALMELIGSLDSATGSSASFAGAISGAAKAVSGFADEMRRAARGEEDVGILAKAFLVVSQTVRVLIADLSFMYEATKREIGAIAAQVAALARFDLSGFSAISKAVKEDAQRARAELDRYQLQVLNPFLNSKGRGSSGFQDPRIIGTTPAKETVGYVPPRVEVDKDAEKAAKRAAQLAEQQAKAAQSYLENLQKQLRAADQLTAVQTVLLDLEEGRLKLAGGVTREKLLELAQMIDLDKEMLAIQEEFKRLEEEAIARKQALKDAGKAVYESTRTPAEQLNIELTRLNKLLQQGAIDWDTYSRAVFAAQDSFDAATKEPEKALSDLEQFRKKALEGTQQTISDALFGAMQGEFDNVFDGFKKMLDRMVAEALAAQLMKKLMGTGTGTETGGGGGGWMAAIGKFIAGLFGGRAAGGVVTAGSMYRVNENGPEMLEMNGRSYLMMGDKSGKVTPLNGAGGAGGSVTVNVINQTGAAVNVQGQSQRRNPDGSMTVDVVLGQVRDALAQEINDGNGTLARSIENRYGLTTAVG